MPGPSFAIVNMRDGMRNDVESFLVDNDSFPILENAYLFRGRIEKRSCFIPLGIGSSRLRWQIGTTDGAGNFGAFNLPDAPITSGVVQFLIGTTLFTDTGGGTMVSTLGGASATLNLVTGAVTITGTAALATLPIYYYPGLPVMGLKTLEESAINDEDLIAFDTRYGYLFDNVTQEFKEANEFPGNVVFTWESTSSDLFWTTNYYHAFWASNNISGYHASQVADAPNEGDGIRWYDPATKFWQNFNPQINSTDFLKGALIILPYKNRLLVFNTYEGPVPGGTTNFPQRVRWSQNGTPFYGLFPALAVASNPNAWRDDIIGRGGFIDAPTQEIIVSAEFIKDTLIVYFERSTWQLVYTANELLPFVWQKINTELGTESTFSIVPFDSGVFGVGNYGIISCNSVEVRRIDQKIPDQVFKIQNKNNGVKRVTGVRDYNSQLVYWNFPVISDGDNDVVTYDLVFPNQLLVYNYLDGSWSQFDDSFTCFGYWQQANDITWAQLPKSWQSTQQAWNSQVFQAKYPDVIAGNQRGFVFVFSQLLDNGQNSPSLEISNIASNIVTIPDHNLVNGDYILITNCTGFTSPNNNIFKVTMATANTFQTLPAIGTGTGYTGAGMVTHLPNMIITTKEFNPFYQNGAGFRLNYLDVFADWTEDGEITAEFLLNDNISSPVDFQILKTSPEPMPTYSTPSPTANFGTTQEKIWHRIYTNSLGAFVQITFTFSDAQMRDLNIATSDVTIHGLICYISPAGRVAYDV